MGLIDDESQVQSKLGPAGSGEFARLESKLLVKRGAGQWGLQEPGSGASPTG